jgi:hypothetical protein
VERPAAINIRRSVGLLAFDRLDRCPAFPNLGLLISKCESAKGDVMHCSAEVAPPLVSYRLAQPAAIEVMAMPGRALARENAAPLKARLQAPKS